MAVLCRFGKQVKQVCKDLQRLGVITCQVTGETALQAEPSTHVDAVQVLTMHSSKGLEYCCVVIPDIGCMPYARATEIDEGRVLYVAMTRATNELLLTHHSDSSFTERLTVEIRGGESSEKQFTSTDA